MKNLAIPLMLILGLGALIATSPSYRPFSVRDTFSYTDTIVLTEEHRTQYVMLDLDCYTSWNTLTMTVLGQGSAEAGDLLISRHNSNVLADITTSDYEFSAQLVHTSGHMGQHIYELHWRGRGNLKIDSITFDVITEDYMTEAVSDIAHPFLGPHSFYDLEQEVCFGRILTCNCSREEGGDITKLEDCDGDGTPYTEDCDECDSDAENYDCDNDGFPAGKDCNDFSYSNEMPYDCDGDGVPNDYDCDDFNYQIEDNGDCDADGIPSQDDCGDQNPALPLATDLDCDGVPSDSDCDDLNPLFSDYFDHEGTISLSSPSELEAWRCLRNLTGSLYIENSNIESISALSALESITEGLFIRNNSMLQDIFDGTTLQDVGYSVIIENNSLLCQSMVSEFVNSITENNEDMIIEVCCNDEDC